MKKIKYLLSFIALTLLMTLVSCSSSLVAPTNLALNSENNTLIWDEVKGANEYLVSANDILYMTSENTFSLTNLEDGSYTLKVQAKKNDNVSPWSDIIKINYSKSSSLNVQQIPGKNEYMVIGVGAFNGEDLVIPEVYKDAPVTTIGESAFENYANIKSVTLGKNIKTIEKNAFKNMVGLENVTFNDGLEVIEDNAFQGDLLLKEVSLPDSIKSLGAYSFSYNKSLTKVTLPSKLKVIPKKLFQECIKLQEVTIPDSVISIEEYAFARNTSLKSLTLSENLEILGNSSFYETSALTSVTIPGSVKVIEPFAFSKSGIKSLLVNEGVEVIDKQAFYEAKNLNSVILPSSLKSIKSFAFDETKLVNDSNGSVYIGNWFIKETSDKTSLTIKNNTLGIAGSAIRDNNNITSVSLPSSLKIIGEYNFYKMDALNNINLNETSVEVIEEAAFNNVISLNITSLPTTLKSVGKYCFMKTINSTLASDFIMADNWVVGHKDPTIKTVTLPSNVTGIGDYAFDNFRNAENVNLSSATNLKYIGEGAFNALTKVSSLTVPNSVTRIGKYAFSNMTSLTNVVLPINLRIIEQSTFYGDLKLRDIDFPLELYKIEKYAFYETNIKELTLPSKVEILESGAFYSNANLTELVLNDGLRIIGSYAFSKAMYLEELIIPSSVEIIDHHAFFGSKNLTKLNLGNVISVGDYAFYDTNMLKSIDLGDSIESIGNYAFTNNEELSYLHLPTSLKSIGDYAFANFKKLESIILPKSLEYVGNYAFEYNKYFAIYMEGSLANRNFASLWNSKFAPVIENCILSSDGTYIKALVIKEPIKNANSYQVIMSPLREGYVFKGWSLNNDGKVDYTNASLNDIPLDTMIYAVYTKIK